MRSPDKQIPRKVRDPRVAIMAKDKKGRIYQGRLISLAIEQAQLPDGRKIGLEVVRHPGGAVVVAVDDSQSVCLLKQYRHAVNAAALWELPAGCIEASDASPLATAQRELEEEAGLNAAQWTELGRVLPSPGFCDEILHLYLARHLQAVANSPQEDEIFEIHWLPMQQALAMAAQGEISDAKTIIGLFRAHHQLINNQ